MAPPNLVPTDLKAWMRLADQYSLRNASIHDEGQLRSASNVDMKRYVLLRTLYSKPVRREVLWKNCVDGWITKDNLDRAKHCLENLESWNAFIQAIKPVPPSASRSAATASHDGTFSLVLYYQKLSATVGELSEVTSLAKVAFSPRMTRSRTARQAATSGRPTTPTPSGKPDPGDSAVGAFETLDPLDPESSPDVVSPSESVSASFSPLTGDIAKQFKAIEDEQIVNMALILFLNALTLHCPGIMGEWSIQRRSFTVRNSKQEKVYEARVDGIFRSKNSDVSMIAEVKPFLRFAENPIATQIRMQESAQMAAWISQHPPRDSMPRTGDDETKQFRRILVSQDRHEIYVTIAAFDSDYVDYICDRRRDNARTDTLSFLVMKEYGPFNLTVSEHMEALGIMLLGFSIQGGI